MMLLFAHLDLVLLILFSLCCTFSCAEKISPYFKTEPKIKQKTINIVSKAHKSSSIAPGHIFIVRGLFGPEIYDNNGDLIWTGLSLVDIRALRFNLCHYPRSRRAHPCFHESLKHSNSGHHAGFFKVLDNSYSLVAEYGRTSGLGAPDGHDVNTPSSCKNCLMQIVYRNVTRNITENGKTREAGLLDSCFQEVDMKKRKTTFEWCALTAMPEGLDLYLKKHPTHPAGTHVNIDVFHMNGIDRNSDGDYLVSLRQIDTVMKIAGNNSTQEPGSIIWRLGTNSTFDEDFIFKGQHTSRFVSSTNVTETISFFNNAWRGGLLKDATSKESAGYLIEINHENKTAHLVQAYKSPNRQLSGTRGSMQVLPSGNVLVGWGGKPRYTEFSPDGKVVLDAQIVDGFSGQAWKYPWVAHPKTRPKVIAYSFDCTDNPLYAYISWNGATEVTHWRFYTGNTSYGPWEDRGTVVKDGFETKIKLSPSFSPYVFAEALSSKGAILARTAQTLAFVPKPSIRDSCTESGCHTPAMFSYSKRQSRGAYCQRQAIAHAKGGSGHKDVAEAPVKSTSKSKSKPKPKPKPKSKVHHNIDAKLLLRAAVLLLAFIEASTWMITTFLWEVILNVDST